MTTLPAKHDAFGGGDLQDGMGASSPFELVDRKEEEIERVREFADITKHSQQQNHLSLSQVKTTEDSSDDSDEQNHGESGGPPKNAGFWDHSMVNVRMHVIKLWARDGKSEFHYHQSAKNPRGWGGGGKGNTLIIFFFLHSSPHPLHRHTLGSFLLRSRLFQYSCQSEKTHRLRRRL